MKQQKRSNSRWLLLAALLLAACNNENPKASNETPPEKEPNMALPAVINYDVVNEYPHDPSAFTEGLEYADGTLYESTGEYGHSDIRKVDLKTGKVLLSTKMESRYFGEGLTLLNGKLYQLTYREGKGFVYDPKSLKQLSSFSFTAAEGWGMTNNGSYLLYDDGSNIIHFLDPNSFKEVKRLAVTDEHGPVDNINELELVKGSIYANQWQSDLILKIDTGTGKVIGRADLSSLRQRVGIAPISGQRGAPEVMNGIAYDASGNRIFITGKNWPKILEIKLDN